MKSVLVCFANITINSNNDKPDSNLVKLCNQFLLHISVGRRDDITTDRPGAKYLWLMCVRQRTKWIYRKLSELECRNVPFLKAI